MESIHFTVDPLNTGKGKRSMLPTYRPPGKVRSRDSEVVYDVERGDPARARGEQLSELSERHPQMPVLPASRMKAMGDE